MTKDQAVKQMVKEFQAIPQDWVRIIMEHHNEYHALPMWDTMFIVDDWFGRTLMSKCRRMVGSKDEVNPLEGETEEEQKRIQDAIDDDDDSVLQEYIDEEMGGELCLLDSSGSPTAVFVYEVDGQVLVGINGAGWNFYDGAWDKVYDALELKWHTELIVSIDVVANRKGARPYSITHNGETIHTKDCLIGTSDYITDGWSDEQIIAHIRETEVWIEKRFGEADWIVSQSLA